MRKKFVVRLKRRQMLANQLVFIPSMMSQHNSTQVPKYAAAGQESHTVNSLIATTSRKRSPSVNNHFVNNRFVSQLNTVSRALS